MDYSLRIYKNEYTELHLNFIRKAFKVNLETEKVIEIVGKEELQIPFYQEAISAKTRQRINPTFTLNADIKENNVIVFDDILTTGATLIAVDKMLPGKNCLYVVGINNN